MTDTASEVYDMVDDQYYEVIEMHGGDEVEYADTSRISTSDGYLLPVQTDRSSEHYADHAVQTDPDCIENSSMESDDRVIKEDDRELVRQSHEGANSRNKAYVTDAEIVDIYELHITTHL
mgnify:FL=1